MNKKEFIDKLMHLLTEDGFSPKLQKSTKLNHPNQDVIVLTAQSMSPVIYIDYFWEDFLNGTSFNEIRDMVIQASTECESEIRNELAKHTLEDWASMRPHIYYRVFPRFYNECLLETTSFPHFFFLDLLITFYIQFENENMSIPITDALLQLWDITSNDLLDAAVENSSKNWYQLKGITTVIAEILERNQISDNATDEDEQEDQKDYLFVLSNQCRSFGASAILNNDTLKNAYEFFDENFYILPSSIHELILLPESNAPDGDINYLRNMVETINASEVDASERLSDSVYYYDHKENTVKIIG